MHPSRTSVCARESEREQAPPHSQIGRLLLGAPPWQPMQHACEGVEPLPTACAPGGNTAPSGDPDARSSSGGRAAGAIAHFRQQSMQPDASALLPARPVLEAASVTVQEAPTSPHTAKRNKTPLGLKNVLVVEAGIFDVRNKPRDAR
eukprot:366202-Chlamydomonas_euryale.AAC.5